MRRSVWGRIESLSWSLWPVGSVFILLLLGVFPRRLFLIPDLLPLLPLIAIHYWRLFRPQLMPYWTILLLGIIQDAVFGLPIGLSGFLYMFYMLVLDSQRRIFVREAFIAIWFGFAVMSLIFVIIQWGMLWWLENIAAPLKNPLISWLLTSCFYPALHLLFNKVYRSLPPPPADTASRL
jgi:rod shape-determining protein MreD